MTITFQQVEPIDESHHDKIIAAFSKLFINWGGQEDGCGDGWDNGGIYGGDGDGDGYGYNGDGYGDGLLDINGDAKCPEEWRVGP
jgi:hypothetical protein